MRYYFPKRVIFETPFEIKPRQNFMINPVDKINLVKAGLKGSFKGIPRNRLMDRRNTILDYTDLLSKIVPHERNTMLKTKVINYVTEILPEMICYILFDNTSHNKSNDSDESEATEDLKSYDLTEDKYKDYSLKEPFKELSDEDWQKLSNMIDSGASIEAFTEYMFAKTKVFALSGPAFGVSKFGFDKFIISVPFNLEKYNLLDAMHLTGRIEF